LKLNNEILIKELFWKKWGKLITHFYNLSQEEREYIKKVLDKAVDREGMEKKDGRSFQCYQVMLGINLILNLEEEIGK